MEGTASRGHASGSACVAVATAPRQAAESRGKRQVCSGKEGRESPEQFGVETEGRRDGGTEGGCSLAPASGRPLTSECCCESFLSTFNSKCSFCTVLER